MTHTTRAAVLAVALLGIVPVASLRAGPLGQPSAAADGRRISAIRDALLRLPYYGVFDFLTFAYDKGTVTLGGYAYLPALAEDAERAVKRVNGVDAVVVTIKTLPVSMNDDDLRWRVFYAIYTNEFLAKYAIGSGVLWGHRHPYGVGMYGPFGAFPGMQPTGNHPIHIIVEGGRVRLLGLVENEADKTVAGIAARGAGGSFGVDNDLVVEKR
ncbi:MAG TPA: BON domain-containing protein [Vicinamibacterales bacterium]|nr:BON domain-containing protein [Vicinamibacterales bacterium]